MQTLKPSQFDALVLFAYFTGICVSLSKVHLFAEIADRCGITDISLKRNEELTILADFAGSRLSWFDGLQGSFEIQHTSALPANSNSAPYLVAARYYTHEYGPFECIWRITEPAGTRIRIQVEEFTGVATTLSAGNGQDPSWGDSLLALPSWPQPVMPSEPFLSFDAHMWVTLRNWHRIGFIKRAKIVFKTYDITGKCRLMHALSSRRHHRRC